MSLDELAQAFNLQLEAQPFLTVDDATLGTGGVDELLVSQLGLAAGELRVTVPDRKVTYSGGPTLVVAGTAAFLGLPRGQEVTLTFLEASGAIVFDLTATPAPGWDFGESFPDLKGSPLEGLLVEGGAGPRAQLVFATFIEAPVPAAPNPFAVVGLNFNGTVGLAEAFGVLLELLAGQAEDEDAALPTSAPLRGPIERRSLVGPDGSGGTGTITVTVTRLEAELLATDQPGKGLKIGPVTVKKIYVALACAYVEQPLQTTREVPALMAAAGDPPATAPIDGGTYFCQLGFAFGGITEFFGRPLGMEIDVSAVPRGSRSSPAGLELVFYAPQPETNIVDLEALLGSGWEAEIPVDFRKSPLFTFGLRRAGVMFMVPEGGDFTLAGLSGTLGLAKPWQVYETSSDKPGSGTKFTIFPLDMSFVKLLPKGEPAGSVEAELTIAGPQLDSPLEFSAAVGFGGGSWTVLGTYLGDFGFSLADLNAAFFHDAPIPEPHGDFFATVTFANPGFQLAYDGSAGKLRQLVLETGLEAELDLLGQKILMLRGGEIAVTYAPGSTATLSAALQGTVFIVEVGFFISATVSSQGLIFEGALLAETPIDLMKFAGQLIPGAPRPPGADRLEITELSVKADTAAGTYHVGGRLLGSWSLPIAGGSFVTVAVTASVDSSRTAERLPLGPAERRHREAGHAYGTDLVQVGQAPLEGRAPAVPVADRTYAVALAGEFTIGDMTIAFGYQFEKGRSVLTGKWLQKAGEKFDYEAVAADLGAQSGNLELPEKGPDLGLAELDLRVEFGGSGGDVFVLSGTSSSGDAGYFVARKAGSSWGFAIGVKLTKSGWVLTEIPQLGDLLSGFGFAQAAVVVASFEDPAFQLPQLLPAGAKGVERGFNFYAEFDLAGNQNELIVQARELIGASSATVLVAAAIAEKPTGFKARFELDVKAQRQLNGFAVEDADIGFAVEGDAFSAWVELQMSVLVHTAQLYFGGRLEVRNEGFDAILWLDTSRTPGGAWRDAFGVSGLTVGDAALLLGISDVDAIPSFGVYGSLSYRSFEGTIVAVLDSETDDPSKNQSMLVASVSDFSLASLAELLAGESVDPGVLSLLGGFAIGGTQLFSAPLTAAEVDALNTELKVPPGLTAAFTQNGFPLPSTAGPSPSLAQEPTPFAGATVAPEETAAGGQGKAGNRAWFVTDRTWMRTYTVKAEASGDAYTAKVELDAQLYLVPNQVTLPHFPKLKPGYHANGELTVFGQKIWIWASVSTGSGQLSLPGIELTAIFEQAIELSDLVWIGSSKTWNSEWWRQRLDTAKEHQLQPNLPLGDGPALSVSTVSDPGAPEGLKKPHVLFDAGVKLIKTGSSSWLAEASALIAILADGSFAFEVSFKIEPPVDGAGTDVEFDLGASFDAGAKQFSGTATARVELGNVDLPAVGAILPGGDELLEADLGLRIKAGEKEDELALEVGFKVFGIGFSFEETVDAEFLKDVVTSLKDFIEDTANVAKVFADILGDSGFAKWLGSVLAGLIKGTGKYFAEAMMYFERTAAEAVALLQELGVGIELAKAAIKVFEGDPTELEELVERIYGLQLESLTLAQRVGPTAGSEPANFDELEKWVGETLLPAVEASKWASVYDPRGQWLAALRLKFLAIVKIGVAFDDPSLASLRLALEMSEPPLRLGVEVSYRRVSEGLGVYTAEVELPASWSEQSFGPLQFSLPPLAISVYTNGDFLVDLGFPFGDDWSDSVQVSSPPLSGSGGFYFGALPAVADNQLPPGSGCNPIVEAGVAVKLAYHAGLDVGIFSGGVDASFSGVLQGAVGFREGSGNFLAAPYKVALRGQLALAASIYGEVDFGIVQGSASLSVSLTLDIDLVTGQSFDLSFEAHIEVHVEIRIHLFIATITIGFSFSATAHVHLELPWSGVPELEPPAEPLAFLPRAAVAAARREAATRAGRPAAAPPPELPILFAPEGSVVYGPTGGSARAVAGLAVEYVAGSSSCPFNELAAAAAHWALASADEGYRLGGRIDRAGLRRAARALRASRRDPDRYRAAAGEPTSASYAKLAGYLSAAFTVTVTAAPAREFTGVPFPMIPDLQLAVSGRADPPGETWPREFSKFEPRGGDWQEWVERYFEEVKVFGGGPAAAAVGAGSGEELPVCEYLFVDWFQMLHEGAVEKLARELRRGGEAELSRDDVDASDFGELAGNITRLFRNGLQIPDAAGSRETKPALDLSGQQFDLLDEPGVPYKLSLAPRPGVGWFGVSGAEASLDTAALDALLKDKGPPGLPNGVAPAPYYATRPRSWPFGTVAALTAGGSTSVLANLPPSLLATLAAAAPLPVKLCQREAGGAGAKPAPAALGRAQGLRVPLRLRQVAGAAGVYEVWGLDHTVAGRLEALAKALAAGDAEAAEVKGVLAWGQGETYETGSAAAATTLLLRTNLTTATAAPHARAAAAADGEQPVVAASLLEAAGVVEILRWYARTNAPGYYLSYPGGLPAGLFGEAGVAEVSLLLAPPPRPAPSPGKPAELALAAWADTVLLGPAASSSPASPFPLSFAYFAEAEASTGLTEAAPVAAPGVVPLSASRLASGPEDPLGSLYSLVTFAVEESAGFEASVTAVPAGPSTSGDKDPTWSWSLFAPVAKFAKGSPPSPYAAIGEDVSLAFSVRDAFGNDLPPDPIVKLPFAYLYSDRLVPVSAWPGVAFSLDFETGRRGTVVLQLSANREALDGDRANPREATRLMRTVVDQLGGPAATVSVATSLAAGGSSFVAGGAEAPYAEGSPTVAGFAASVLAYLEGGGAAPAPCTIELTPPQPISTQEPVEMLASIAVERVAHVDPGALAAAPEVGRAASEATPAPAKSEAKLAEGFAAAFPGYVLAAAAGEGHTFYAVSRKLLEVEIAGAGGDPVYFSPLPVSPTLVSGSVEVPAYAPGQKPPLGPLASATYTDADLDGEMAALFAAVDSVLAPASAAAARAVAPAAFEELVAARAALAQQYTERQLAWLFAEQTPSQPAGEDLADLELARSVFSAQLDASLASAFQIEVLLQTTVSWLDSSAGEGVSATVDLYGSVEPADKTDPAASRFDRNAAKVRLRRGSEAVSGRLTFTSTLGSGGLEPGAPPYVSLPLSYQVTDLVLGDTAGTGLGGEATWLRLVEPVTVAVGDPEAPTPVPVPWRQFPVPPTLAAQRWAPQVAPGGGEEVPSFADLRGWSYGYEYAYAEVLPEGEAHPAPPDGVYTVVSYNDPAAARSRVEGGNGGLGLAEALTLFAAGYRQVAADLASLPTAADPAAAVEYLAFLVVKVLGASWQPPAPEPPPAVGDDAFRVEFVEQPPPGEEGPGAVLRLSSASAEAVASATVTPCGPHGPLPEGKLRRYYDPGAKERFVVYEPAAAEGPGADGWLSFALEVDGLDVLSRQSAWASVQVLRNVELLPRLTTNPGYVYRSRPVRAAKRVTPALAQPDRILPLAAMTGHASGSVVEYVEWLLTDLLTAPPGAVAPPSFPVRIGVDLEIGLNELTSPSGQVEEVVGARTPIALTPTLLLASPGEGGAGEEPTPTPIATLAAALGGAVEAFLAEGVASEDASLLVSATVFADDPEAHAAILSLGRLLLPLSTSARSVEKSLP